MIGDVVLIQSLWLPETTSSKTIISFGSESGESPRIFILNGFAMMQCFFLFHFLFSCFFSLNILLDDSNGSNQSSKEYSLMISWTTLVFPDLDRPNNDQMENFKEVKWSVWEYF